MKKIIFAVLLSIGTFAMQAQVNADSLWAVWNDEDQADTNRLKAMDDLSFQHYMRSLSDLDSAFYCAQQTIDLAKEKELKKYEAIGLHNMASVEINRGDLDLCLELSHQSLALRTEIGDKKQIGRSLAMIGLVHRVKGDSKIALEYNNDALANFEEAGDKALISHALSNISYIYSGHGQTQKAIDFLSRALIAMEGSKDPYIESTMLIGMGNLYLNAEDPTKAKEYAELAIEKSKKVNYLAGELQALLLYGNILSSEGEHEEAILICEEVLSATQKNESPTIRNYAFTLMGWTYQELGDYDNALKYYKEGIKISESLNLKSTALTNAIELGMVYKLKKDGKNALKWCEKGLSLAEIAGDIKHQSHACKCLYESHKLLNNGSKALDYHERFLVLNDSLQMKEAGQKLQELEFERTMFQDSIAQAETDRLVFEAHQEEVRKKNKTKNIFFGVGLFSLLLAGGLFSRNRYIKRSRDIIEKEKDRSNNLLLNILPADIAEELKIHGKAEARDFDMVSILFTDFKGFTEASSKMTASMLVTEINACFEAFDAICEKYKVEKIKTIGDAYMAAGGLPVPTDDSTKNTILAALEMQAFISKRKAEMDAQNKPAFEMRVGIHTGHVVAGIVGVKKFQYDIWGDTVNTASRIESKGEAGKVNISQATYDLLKDDPQFTFESRGKIEAKGKGEMAMYFVKGTS
ncbi:MAG: tetratricopeptide repeat protein [Flavobacteriales bacterium]|nr:tetratricopeptide repeat protein [Flavobacteriales bacterium]